MDCEVTQEYWSIDIPALTEERAVEIRELLLPDAPFGIVLSDPAKFMVGGNDRWTVESLVKIIELAFAQDDLTRDERVGARSVLEDYQGWLSTAPRLPT